MDKCKKIQFSGGLSKKIYIFLKKSQKTGSQWIITQKLNIKKSVTIILDSIRRKR